MYTFQLNFSAIKNLKDTRKKKQVFEIIFHLLLTAIQNKPHESEISYDGVSYVLNATQMFLSIITVRFISDNGHCHFVICLSCII